MCGIFGIYGHSEASNITYLGLHALQHRGQESAGIVSADGRGLHARREIRDLRRATRQQRHQQKR